VTGAKAVHAEGLAVRYPGQDGLALRDVDLQVACGSRVALVGPNGSGKSTLLKASVGLLEPTHGEVRVYGHAPASCQHRVAYLPQRAQVDWRFPISLRGLALAGRYPRLGWLRRPSRGDQELVMKTLDRVGLGDLAERQVGELSGGQQQRALLARALVQEADLLLLDEPMNAVDAQTRAVFCDVLMDLQRSGCTTIIATHDPIEVETGFDDVVYLAGGRIAEPAGPVPAWS
jgi:manganese/zinc/iron transport system ATP- binding protein